MEIIQAIAKVGTRFWIIDEAKNKSSDLSQGYEIIRRFEYPSFREALEAWGRHPKPLSCDHRFLARIQTGLNGQPTCITLACR